jgi:hypothetical protein
VKIKFGRDDHSLDMVEKFETAGFVMSGNRNRRKYIARLTKELTASLEKDRKGIAMATIEERDKREEKVLEELKRLAERKREETKKKAAENAATPKART